MGAALSKTIGFVILIGIGIVLKKRLSSKEELSGIKTLILTLALPATIFIALLKIDVKANLLILPLIALITNLVIFLSTYSLTTIIGVENSPRKRTILLLTASMAPGLSCFPFIAEFLGETHLAYAAFADVGNKFYGLILLYLLAMHWYYKRLNAEGHHFKSNRILQLLKSMVSEPINIVLIVALVMLAFGLNFSALPVFIQDVIQRISLLMTPLVLIFIGLAVKINREDLLTIFQVIFWKSGVAFLISGIILLVLPLSIAAPTMMLAVIFPQSACSFWPIAHMGAIQNLERDTKGRTFDLKFGLNLLAFSLPFSTAIILLICSFGDIFIKPAMPLTIGFAFVGITCILTLTSKKSLSLFGSKVKNAPAN